MAARVLHNARLCLSLQMPPGGSGRPYFDHIVMLFPIIAICFFFARASLRFALIVPMFIHGLARFPNLWMKKEKRHCEMILGCN